MGVTRQKLLTHPSLPLDAGAAAQERICPTSVVVVTPEQVGVAVFEQEVDFLADGQ